MADAVTMRPKLPTQELIVNIVLIVVLVQVVRFLYSGVRIRLKIRQLQAQGIVCCSPRRYPRRI